MSSALDVRTAPPVAPWQADFERVTGQVVAMLKVSNVEFRFEIPQGQWMRLVFFWGFLNTSAAVGNRIVSFVVTDAGEANPLVSTRAPATIPASTACGYLTGPGQSVFSNLSDPANSFQSQSYPDMLYPQGYHFKMYVPNAQAGDALNAAGVPNIGYEIWRPRDMSVSMPLSSIATPLLT